MTVQELRNRLQFLPDNAEIIVTTQNTDVYLPVVVSSGYYCRFNLNDENGHINIYDEEILEEEDFNSNTLKPCVQIYVGEV